ncbi:MAG: N-acetylneuraminate synthase family protein, partial [Chloroflexi bacterium]|nr:N-acetylneuraminate synthase family protein [Chloroflexota bacterium]
MTGPTCNGRGSRRREPVFIIAEAGVNHDGDLARAQELVDVAALAGADAIKFQTFRADQLVRRDAKKAAYQARATGDSESQFQMIRKLELTEADHEVLVERARARGIAFLSTPFDLSSLRLLTDRFGLTSIKIPSGEITNAPFLLVIARASQRVLLSTGMSTLSEVEAALGVLAFGFTAPAEATPMSSDFDRAFASDDGQRSLRERVTLLHCTSEYPAPVEEVNLRAMDTMAKAFGVPVGYSDHTTGIHVSLAAVALGACVIEKHFTLDRRLPG